MQDKDTPHPDQKYIEALLNNDSRLINEIYAKYSHRITSFVRANNGSAKDAGDVGQCAV